MRNIQNTLRETLADGDIEDTVITVVNQPLGHFTVFTQRGRVFELIRSHDAEVEITYSVLESKLEPAVE